MGHSKDRVEPVTKSLSFLQERLLWDDEFFPSTEATCTVTGTGLRVLTWLGVTGVRCTSRKKHRSVSKRDSLEL